MTAPLIKLEGIQRVFHVGEIDVQALREVSLVIEQGELVALIGPSGSGKTTLMNLLGCLDRPSSGEYWLNGEATSRLSARQRALLRNRNIGFVFQSFNLLPRTTAVEQVMMPLSYTASSLADSEAHARAVTELKAVGLGERLDHTPAQMSGGQQQRVAIARALINHPPLLLADEPTGNLDSRTTLEILAMLQALNRTSGVTVIIVTHDPTVAAHTRRNIRLSDGLIVSDQRIEPIIAVPPPATQAAPEAVA
jgi:ABC-type lipoprotein export system ATPase subunit